MSDQVPNEGNPRTPAVDGSNFVNLPIPPPPSPLLFGAADPGGIVLNSGSFVETASVAISDNGIFLIVGSVTPSNGAAQPAVEIQILLNGGGQRIVGTIVAGAGDAVQASLIFLLGAGDIVSIQARTLTGGPAVTIADSNALFVVKWG